MSEITSLSLHPVLVYVPLVFIAATAISDHAAVFSGESLGGKAPFSRLSIALIGLAAVATLVTFFNGTYAYEAARHAGIPGPAMGLHRDLGTALTVLIFAWAVIRASVWSRIVPLTRMWNILFAAAGLGLLIHCLVTFNTGGSLPLPAT